MKVCEKLERNELRTALGICGRVTPRRATNEVLTFVKLERGTLEANDGEMRVLVPSSYQGDAILLPYHKLAELARVASGDNLELEATGTKATIKSHGGKWTLPTIEPAKWPTAQQIKKTPVARIPADQLARGIAAVIDAADPQAGRFELSGVNVDVTDGLVTLVATDGRRLYTHEIEIDQAVDNCQVLLTYRAATLLGVLAGQLSDEGDVQLERSGSEVFAEIGDNGPQIIARQLAGNFPKWQDTIPRVGRATPTTVRAHQLCEAIKQAAICTSESHKSVELAMGKKIVCEATSSESGNSRVELAPLEAGKTVTVRVNPQFCVEWLRRIDPVEPVTVEAVDADNALVFRSEDSVGVVMPMEAT